MVFVIFKTTVSIIRLSYGALYSFSRRIADVSEAVSTTNQQALSWKRNLLSAICQRLTSLPCEDCGKHLTAAELVIVKHRQGGGLFDAVILGKLFH